MPELPGLEVWCPSKRHAESRDLSRRGEWVRPTEPPPGDDDDDDGDCAYVIALAGEFLQLLSDGRVPTCIHRVVAPPSPAARGIVPEGTYEPRISAPLFVRPRRTNAILDVGSYLKRFQIREESEVDPTVKSNKGLYFEEGLMEECDGMDIWEYMDCMSPNN